MRSSVFLLIASFPDSLIKFRGELIEALIVAGCQVHVAVPDLESDSKIAKQLEGWGVTIHDIRMQRTGMNPLRDFSVMLHLRKLMCRIGADYVLGYTVKPVIYGSIAASLARVPRRFALITGLGYAFTGEPTGLRKLLRGLIQYLYRFGLSRTHKVFFQNPDDERLFRDLGLLPTSVPSCVVNGSGVDLAEYAVTTLPTQPSFLLIARLLGDKGVREYVQAAAIVKGRYPEARFKLVGWIDDNPDAISREELETWVDAGTVDFLGKLADVRSAIAESSVYVLPSYREGLPRTVLEAMAMGRAVITTDAPGCRETVVDGQSGFLVPVQDSSALADSMIKLIERPDLIKSMGRCARQIAEEKYDVNKVNDVMIREMNLR
jgi:glycosyltransferase involved in cell wall biosynthesis